MVWIYVKLLWLLLVLTIDRRGVHTSDVKGLDNHFMQQMIWISKTTVPNNIHIVSTIAAYATMRFTIDAKCQSHTQHRKVFYNIRWNRLVDRLNFIYSPSFASKISKAFNRMPTDAHFLFICRSANISCMCKQNILKLKWLLWNSNPIITHKLLYMYIRACVCACV